MGFFSEILGALDELGGQIISGVAYIEEAGKKFDFRNFDDVVSCCDEANSADEDAKRTGYVTALITDLSQLNSDGRVSDEYIIEIYGYCRGMNYDYIKKQLESIMDDLAIDY